MKTRNFLAVSLLSLMAISFFSCNSTNESDMLASKAAPLLNVSAEGISTVSVNNVCSVLVATNALTADEIEFLYAIREDEKLAKDITTAFATAYPGTRTFTNIAAAEATHIAAIENVLNFYEIQFPALGVAGVFADATRQTKYNEAIAKGTSLVEAFKVTALLEEESIAAYTTVAPTIMNVNIQLIVTNLQRGSTNHFKAYIRQLSTLGVTYTPTLLDQATYDLIISSPFGGGSQYGCTKNGSNTNSGKGHGQHGAKGSVNAAGVCTSTTNGTTPGTCTGTGQAGKGYRGGR